MNSTNPICDPFPKVAKESKAALPVESISQKNIGKIRLSRVECTENLNVIETVNTIALTTLCDVT